MKTIRSSSHNLYKNQSNRPNNPCIRCGKERIVVKTWKEQAGNSTLTHTTMSCPDPECQKVVDKQLFAQKEQAQTTERAREERKAAHQLRLKAARKP